MNAFAAMLNPMLVMIICMGLGFVLKRTKIVPDNSAKVLAVLETWVFAPALSFITMARNFTQDTLEKSGVTLLIGALAMAISVLIAIPVGRLLAGKPEHRGVFIYGLALGNFGYLCDAVVLSLFGDNVLAFYKLFTLPMSIMVYTWGIALLVPKGAIKGNALKRIINFPTIATVLGLIVGITGLGRYLPDFAVSTLDSLKSCMGPVAMIIAGITVSGYGIRELLKNKRVYVTSAIKLIILPIFMCSAVYLIKLLVERIFNISLDNTVMFLGFFAFACPLGLNTIVFPESYGGDSRPGASMAIISHALSVITMPLFYALLVILVGEINI